MKYKYLIFFFIFFYSCSVLLPERLSFNFPNYNYDYQTFNKRLDKLNKKYLLNSTTLNKNSFNNGTYFPFVYDFFHKKLQQDVIKVNQLKNIDGRLIIPFPMNYDLTNDNIKFLRENTFFDYIILTKIEYLGGLNKNTTSPLNLKRLNSSKAGAISYVKIFDIKNNLVFIEMSCTADVTINENRDMYSGVSEFQPITIHKDSYALGEKAMKKLLKKIN